MAWDEGQTLGTRWDHACTTAKALHPHWDLGQSYAGFTAALVRETPRLLAAVLPRLRRMLPTLAGRYWHCGRWDAFAVDGSRAEAPHTEANEAGLGCAGKAKTAPQVYLTTVWHLGLGLPWDCRLGPGTASERDHLLAMVDALPPRVLLVADAGFGGYEVCRTLLHSGRSFLLRVGGNVRLLAQLGYYRRERGDIVYLWPREQQRRGRGQPLVLRLIRLAQGKQVVYLLTNVLERHQLTPAAARVLYGLRWGEEVFYRSFKQTLGRRKLLSRTAATCLAEGQWNLVGLWLLGLLSVARIIRRGGNPKAWSVATARDVVRQAVRNEWSHRRPRWPLTKLLAEAVQDEYERTGSKEARNYPRKKKQKPPGPPKVRTANAAEIKRAARLERPNIELRWTA